jgi:hypothetical protein
MTRVTLRISLLTAGTAAALTLFYCAGLPRHAAAPVRSSVRPDSTARRDSVAVAPNAAVGQQTLPDTDFASRSLERGVLWAAYGTPEFVYLSERDSIGADSTAFLTPAAILDSTTIVVGHGRSVPVVLRVDSLAAVDSSFRHDDRSGCAIGVHVPVRARIAADSSNARSWTLGLRADAAEPLPATTLGRADSVLDEREALRLATAFLPLVVDTTRDGVPMPGSVPAQWARLLASAPFSVALARRFHLDSTDVLIAQLSRSRGDSSLTIEDHLLLVAESQPGDRSRRLTTAWSERSVDDPDQATISQPTMLLRLNASHRYALVVDAKYRDGAGGFIVGRTAPGRWRQVASWYTGC